MLLNVCLLIYDSADRIKHGCYRIQADLFGPIARQFRTLTRLSFCRVKNSTSTRSTAPTTPGKQPPVSHLTPPAVSRASIVSADECITFLSLPLHTPPPPRPDKAMRSTTAAVSAFAACASGVSLPHFPLFASHLLFAAY